MAGLLDFLGTPSGGLLDLLRNSNAAIANNPGGLASDAARYGNQMQANAYAPAQLGTPQALPQSLPQDNSLPASLSTNQPGFMNFYQSMKHGGGLIGSLYAGLTGQRNDPLGIQQQQLQAQYQSLIPVLGPQKALLAVLNPEAGKTLLTEALTNKEQFTKTGTDAMGRDIYGFVNPLKQTVNGQPIGANGAIPGTNPEGLGNMNLSGDAYLSSLPKAVANTVKGMVSGTIAPPSSFALSKPYWQSMIAAAQNYDPTFDATKWGARETMRKDLAKSTPGSAGGQQTFMNTSLSHLAEVAQKAKDLGTVDLGFSPLTHLVNEARGLTTTQQAKIQALQDAAQHYGQEVTKFYAGSPGGEAERARFLSALSGAKSPQELAAVLESELNLIPGRGNELETRIRNTLGDNYLAQNPILSKESQDAIQKTRKVIDELRGTTPPSAQSSPQRPMPKAGDIQGGYRFKGGNPADKNNWEPTT